MHELLQIVLDLMKHQTHIYQHHSLPHLNQLQLVEWHQVDAQQQVNIPKLHC